MTLCYGWLGEYTELAKMSSKWMSAEFTKSHKHVQENDEFAVTLYEVRVFIEVTFCLMWFHYSTFLHHFPWALVWVIFCLFHRRFSSRLPCVNTRSITKPLNKYSTSKYCFATYTPSFLIVLLKYKKKHCITNTNNLFSIFFWSLWHASL